MLSKTSALGREYDGLASGGLYDGRQELRLGVLVGEIPRRGQVGFGLERVGLGLAEAGQDAFSYESIWKLVGTLPTFQRQTHCIRISSAG